MNNTSKWGCWPKILKFDCMWATIDFCPNTVDFQAFEQLTEQTPSARLETWHGWSWEHIRTIVRIWDPLDSSILMKNETLIWDRLPLGESLSGQLLNFLEQFGDITCNVLRNMKGKILGYNNSVTLWSLIFSWTAFSGFWSTEIPFFPKSPFQVFDLSGVQFFSFLSLTFSRTLLVRREALIFS